MPGKHNILNSLAAIAVSLDLEIPFNIIANALKSFAGIDRRFTFKGTYNGAELFDDYGHHPTEIYNTLLVAQKRAKKKLIVVFQPQRYTRTHKLWQEFINVFGDNPVDKLIITDIYSASEEPIANITSKNLVEQLKQKYPHYPVCYIPYDPELKSIRSELEPVLEQDNLILLLGAGKVNKLPDILNKK